MSFQYYYWHGLYLHPPKAEPTCSLYGVIYDFPRYCPEKPGFHRYSWIRYAVTSIKGFEIPSKP